MSDLSVNMTPQNVGMLPSRSPNTGASVAVASVDPNPGISDFIISPKGTIDSQSGMYVIQFRDDNGEVTMQYPSVKAASAYSKAAASQKQSIPQKSSHVAAPVRAEVQTSDKPVAVKAPAPAKVSAA